MRKSKLEKLIRDDFRKVVPIDSPKFDLSEIVSIENSPTNSHKMKFAWPVSRSLAMVMSLILVVLLAWSINWGIGQVTTTTTTNTTDSSVTTPTTNLNPIDEINAKEYANPILTASKLSYGFVSSGAFNLNYKLADEPSLMDDHIDLVNQYMNALESTLDFADSVVIPLQSDKPEYAYRVQTSTLNVLAESEVYDMYYNIIEEDDDEISMSGIVVWNEVTSYFVGEFENESNEQKLIIIAYESEILGDDYIRTEFQLEDEEQSYEIEVVNDGMTIASSFIKIEVEGDESKIQVALAGVNQTIEIEIKKETDDDGAFIVITYDIEDILGNESGEMDVIIVFDPLEDHYYYHYYLRSGDIVKEYQKDRIMNSVPDSLLQSYSALL